jgi:hypothetical protein
MLPSQHPAASEHMPGFITGPGQTDILFVIMTVVLIGAVLGIGVFFFWLHSLPERMVHNKIQFDLVAVLALLSLFTHIHAFWVAGLLIALIDLPDFSFPKFSGQLGRIAGSLEKIAERPMAIGAEEPTVTSSADAEGSKPLPLTPPESQSASTSPDTSGSQVKQKV